MNIYIYLWTVKHFNICHHSCVFFLTCSCRMLSLTLLVSFTFTRKLPSSMCGEYVPVIYCNCYSITTTKRPLLDFLVCVDVPLNTQSINQSIYQLPRHSIIATVSTGQIDKTDQSQCNIIVKYKFTQLYDLIVSILFCKINHWNAAGTRVWTCDLSHCSLGHWSR